MLHILHLRLLQNNDSVSLCWYNISLLLLHLINFEIEALLICSVSGIQQSDSVRHISMCVYVCVCMCMFFSPFNSIIVSYKILKIVPCPI